MTKRDRKWAWKHSSDDLDIGDTSPDQHIREVLEEIGRGDEFETLRDMAIAKIPQPNLPERLVSDEEARQQLAEVAEQVRSARNKAGFPNPTRSRDFK